MYGFLSTRKPLSPLILIREGLRIFPIHLIKLYITRLRVDYSVLTVHRHVIIILQLLFLNCIYFLPREIRHHVLFLLCNIYLKALAIKRPLRRGVKTIYRKWRLSILFVFPTNEKNPTFGTCRFTFKVNILAFVVNN